MIYTKVDGLELKEVEDGFVVYHAQRGTVCFLNATAALVYDLCDGNRSIGDIARQVQTFFELRDAPESDVSTCCDTLVQEGLICLTASGRDRDLP